MTSLSVLDTASGGAPGDSLLTMPAGALVARSGSQSVVTAESEPRIIRLRGPIAAFQGHEIPDPAEVRVRQNRDHERLSLLAEAKALTEQMPRSPTAWARLAQTLVSMGRSDEAAAAARITLDLEDAEFPDRAAEFVAVRVLVAVGATREAEEVLQVLSADYGPWTCVYSALAADRGEYAEALERLGDAPGVDGVALRGYLLLRLGQFAPALHVLRMAGGEGSADPGLLVNLAYAHAALGSSRKAIRAARQAALLASRDADVVRNLAGHLIGAGQPGMAVLELKRRIRDIGADLKSELALASAMSTENRIPEAVRELRRVTSMVQIGRNTVDFAELKAFLTVLEWRTKRLTRKKLISMLREQLELVGGQSLRIAVFLADHLAESGIGRSGEISRMYERLLLTNDEDKLLPLKVRVLLSTGDVAEAATVAERWSSAFPLDPDAAAIAIQLRALALGDFEGAAAFGLQTVRRMPGHLLVRNNAAFAAALAGRGEDAARILNVLPVASTDLTPYLLATRGLVDLSLGRVADGLREYEEAAELAVSDSLNEVEGLRLRRLVEANRAFVLYHLGLSQHAMVSDRVS